MKHTLPTELINRIIAYLSTKAYNEVMGLIMELQTKAVPVPEDAPPAAPESN